MAKKKARTPIDQDALIGEVADLEALVKRRKKAEAQLRALDEGDDVDPDDAPLPGSELIEQVMSELGGDGSFSIVKLEGGKTMDMGTHDLTLWPDAMEELVKVQGGGNYVLIFRRPDGTIAKRIKRTYPASLYPGPVKEAPSGSGDMLAMLKIMEDRDARREMQNETLRLEAMKGQQSMMTAMMTMMGSQNKPLINNATELATIAKLFGDNKKGTDLSELVALKDLLDDLRGDPDEGGIKVETDNPMVALLAPILSALGKGLNAKPRIEAAPVPAPAAIPPAPVAVQPAVLPPAPSGVVSSPSPQESGLLEHANMLRTAIDGGVTPVIAADKAWEDAESKGQEKILIELIERGDWDGLKKHPDLSMHVAWLDAFRAALRDGIEPVEVAPAPVVPVATA
jgi:hypothetical protein